MWKLCGKILNRTLCKIQFDPLLSLFLRPLLDPSSSITDHSNSQIRGHLVMLSDWTLHPFFIDLFSLVSICVIQPSFSLGQIENPTNAYFLHLFHSNPPVFQIQKYTTTLDLSWFKWLWSHPLSVLRPSTPQNEQNDNDWCQIWIVQNNLLNVQSTTRMIYNQKMSYWAWVILTTFREKMELVQWLG